MSQRYQSSYGTNVMKEGKQSPGSTPPGEGPKAKKRGLDREIQNQIGRQLRSLYVDVVQEGVPDRFAELLQRLDEQELPEAQSSSDKRPTESES